VLRFDILNSSGDGRLRRYDSAGVGVEGVEFGDDMILGWRWRVGE